MVNSLAILNDYSSVDINPQIRDLMSTNSFVTAINSYAKNNEELTDLQNYLSSALHTALKTESVVVPFTKDFLISQTSNISPLRTNQFVMVKSKNISQKSLEIAHLLRTKVFVVNENIVLCEYGDVYDNEEIASQKKSKHINFRKTDTILPVWLDTLLFNNMSAKYAPEHSRYDYNLDLNDSELKVYLGTYFPRSYAENFCIAENLFLSTKYQEQISKKTTLKILDFGCGTGGALIGLLLAIERNISTRIAIEIYACDGNEKALGILDGLLAFTKTKLRHHINYYLSINLLKDNDVYDPFGNNKYDYVLCSKMVCELISHKVLSQNAYYTIAKHLSSRLENQGLLLLLDVTTKDEKTDLYYPQLMTRQLNKFIKEHNEYETLLPMACHSSSCTNSCFIQQIFTVSHSRKDNDQSKVCYRVIGHKAMVDSIIPSCEGFKHIVHTKAYYENNDNAFCIQSKGAHIIDSFNLNI